MTRNGVVTAAEILADIEASPLGDRPSDLPRGIRHGSDTAYNHGCRCTKCKQSKADQWRRYKAAKAGAS